MSVSNLKNAGGAIAGFLILLVVLAIPIMLLMGAAEFSVWALDWIPSTIGMATFGCLILIPLGTVPATRGLAANLFQLAALVFGVCLWLYALAYTYLDWGMLGVLIGMLIFGVGVVFTGTLAAVFSGEWVVVGNLALLFTLSIGTRLLGAWLTQLAYERRLRGATHHQPSKVVLTQSSGD